MTVRFAGSDGSQTGDGALGSRAFGRWNRLLLGTGLGVLLLLAGVTPSGTASADTSSPQVTLTPSAGLVDRQEITVSGTSFPGSVQVAVIQCRRGSPDAAGCDLSTLRYVDVAPDGTFSTPFSVRHSIATGSGVDCSIPNACQIGAGVMPNGSPSADTPVEVAAFVPPAVRSGDGPTCPSPYKAVGYFLGAVDVPALPPGITGTVFPYPEAGETVTVVPDGKALLLTVTLDGVTRQFTTAPHPLGADYNQPPVVQTPGTERRASSTTPMVPCTSCSNRTTAAPTPGSAGASMSRA